MRSSCRASAGSSGSRSDARFVVDGSRVRVGARRTRQEARCRPDRALTRHEPPGACPSGPVPGRPAEADDRGGEEAPDHGARLGVHDELPLLRAARDEHQARGDAARRHDHPARQGVLSQRRARQAHQGQGLRRPRRRSSTAGSRMQSEAASARSRRPSSTPRSSPGSSSSPTRRTSSTSRAIRWDARRPSPGAAPS